jgi:TonB family protein
LEAWSSQLITELMAVAIFFAIAASAQTDTEVGRRIDQKGSVEEAGYSVKAPRLVYAPDPEYSAEARDAQLEGPCVLSLVVGIDGHARDIKVVQELGHGLDQKAIEAAKEWRFEPALKDGKPVAVQSYVEVQFKLRHLGIVPSEELAKPAPQSVKIVPYEQQQLAKLREKCAPYADFKIEDVDRNQIPLPPHECRGVVAWMRDSRVDSLYQEQSAKLREKCAPYANTKVQDLESKRVPLPPHECSAVLAWMRNSRVESLYRSQKTSP